VKYEKDKPVIFSMIILQNISSHSDFYKKKNLRQKIQKMKPTKTFSSLDFVVKSAKIDKNISVG